MMNSFSRQILIIFAVSTFIVGCHDHGPSLSTVARVRLVDAVPSPSRIDLSLNGHTIVRHVEYGSDSGYTELDPGHYSLGVRSDHGTGVASVSGELERGSSYTVIAMPIGDAGDLGLSVIRENDASAVGDRATLRFIDASPDMAKLSLALNNVIAVDGLRYKTESASVNLRPGDYDLKLWTGDDSAQLLGPSPIRLEAGRSYTIVAMGRRVDGSLTLRTFEDK